MTPTGAREAEWQAWGGLERLPAWSPPPVPRGSAQALVLAPHPDDETLGLGGTLQRLASCGWDLTVVVVTDGEASHPDWSSGGARGLADVRRAEFARAMSALGVGPRRVEHLRLPDGAVADHADALAGHVDRLVAGTGLVLAPHPLDGHPDHDAVGAAARDAGRAHAVPVLAYGVWLWAWSAPGDVRYPWPDAVRVELDAAERARKREAIEVYRSQLDAVDGQAPILAPEVLDHHLRDVEVLFPLDGLLGSEGA